MLWVMRVSTVYLFLEFVPDQEISLIELDADVAHQNSGARDPPRGTLIRVLGFM
jgi:hypothetical protein